MPSSRGRISNSPPRPAKNCSTTRKSSWPTATAGRPRSPAPSPSRRPIDEGGEERTCHPGEGVLSREIGQSLGGCLVIEASQSGVIIVGDEGVEIGISLGMVEEASVMGGAVLRQATQVLGEAAIKAFDHAVGLRPEGSGQPVEDAVAATDDIEEVVAGGFVLGLGLFVDGEAVGELGAVVGQDGVDGRAKEARKRLRK